MDDKKFLWLLVIHLLEDYDFTKNGNIHDVLKELDTKFNISLRQNSPINEILSEWKKTRR